VFLGKRVDDESKVRNVVFHLFFLTLTYIYITGHIPSTTSSYLSNALANQLILDSMMPILAHGLNFNIEVDYIFVT
jgi:hypothetical protein